MTDTLEHRKVRTKHELTDRCIYPMNHANFGVYYRVMLTRNSVRFQKDFFANRNNGAENARKMAIAWRDQVIAENSPKKLADFCAALRSTNKTGVAGVCRRVREYEGADGKITEHVSWKAVLPAADGTSHTKSFSVARFGEEAARQMALEARQAALAKLADAVFRPSEQPQPISSTEDLVRLQAKLGAPVLRRQTALNERAERKRAREERYLARHQHEVQRDAERLAQPTNRSGMPYITRTETTSTTGYWRVSMDANGTRHRKTFSDSRLGGKDSALKEAISWRDTMFARYKARREITPLVQRPPHNTSGVAGVFLAGANEEQTRGYWVAHSPKRRGKPQQSRRFSIAKYGFDEAFNKAVRAREVFVAAALEQSGPTHLVARKLLQHLASARDA